MKFKLSFLSLSLLLIISSFTGCSYQIKTLSSPIQKEKKSISDVSSSIIFGAINANWEVIKINDNLLKAKYILGRNKHIMFVTIPFSQKKYEIKYDDSVNLEYDKENNTIHGAYHDLVEELQKSINISVLNNAIYSGTLKENFTDSSIKNEHGNEYRTYFHHVNKSKFNKKQISILKAKEGYGFVRIGDKKLSNEFKMNTGFGTHKFIDYILTQPGKYEVVLGAPIGNNGRDARLDTIIFEMKAGHEYLFDYSENDGVIAYWIQDLTTNKRINYTKNTNFRDRARFFSQNK